MAERVLSPRLQGEEIGLNTTIQPQTLDEFIGEVDSARTRGADGDHALVTTGKAELAALEPGEPRGRDKTCDG